MQGNFRREPLDDVRDPANFLQCSLAAPTGRPGSTRARQKGELICSVRDSQGLTPLGTHCRPIRGFGTKDPTATN